MHEHALPKGVLAGHSPSTIQMRWRLLPQFMLRQAGFPIEWLDELSSATVANAASILLNGYAEISETRRAALESIRDLLHARCHTTPTVLDQSLIELRARLEKGKSVRPFVIQTLAQHDASSDLAKRILAWNARLQHLDNLYQTYVQKYMQADERESLLVLRRFCNDQRLREVLLLSNEANFDIFARWLDSWKDLIGTRSIKSGDRQKINTLVMYFQRICAKNDTNSHFGPVSVGQVVLEREGMYWKSERPLKRVAFYTHWAASAIAQQMSHDRTIIKWLRPRWTPYAFLDKSNLRLLNFDYNSSLENEIHRGLRFLPSHPLTEDEATILQACDGERTLLELFAWWQQGKPASTWEAFWTHLETLERYGALTIMFEVPVGSLDPLGDLQALLPQEDPAASAWVDILGTAKTMLHQFATADDLIKRRTLFTGLKEQFEQVTGSKPERGWGKTYADRSILFEECLRDLRDLSVGGALANVVKDELAIFYDLLLLVPRHRFEAERRMLNDWFVHRFGRGVHVPLETFLTAYLDDAILLEQCYKIIDGEINTMKQTIDDTLLPPSAMNDTVIEVKPDTLRELIKAYSLPIPALCNPDVMVSASSLEAIRAGEFQVLVGDCHALRDLLSHSTANPFFQEVFPNFATDVMKLYHSLLEDDEEVVDVIRGHPTKVSAQLTLSCPDLETLGRSPKPRDNVIALHDLLVFQMTKGLRLYSPQLQKFVRLMTSGFGAAQMRRNPFSIFSFPRHYEGHPIQGNGRSHIPRIVMNQIIIQRQLWRIPAETLAEPVTVGCVRLDDGEAGVFLRAKRLQQNLKLPRYGFARIAEEMKPIYVDFDFPLVVRQLARLAKQTSSLIEFSEMIPSPGQLWLQDAQGHYTTELRFAVFSSRK